VELASTVHGGGDVLGAGSEYLIYAPVVLYGVNELSLLLWVPASPESSGEGRSGEERSDE